MTFDTDGGSSTISRIAGAAAAKTAATHPTEHEYAAPWTMRGQVRLPWIQHSRQSTLAVSS